MSNYAIQVNNVEMRYGSVDVLRGVSFAVPKASFTALTGKSGSGKSTLLGLISGLEKPSEGQIRVGNADLARLDDDGLARLRRDLVGIVFQSFNLIPSLSAIENVLVPTFASERAGTEHRRRAEELLDKVGLAHRADHRPGALSGGEQQRVAIARALINSPDVLLADEPTGNLDEATSAAILDLMLGMCRDAGTTLLIATHDRDIAAKANYSIELRDGSINNAIS